MQQVNILEAKTNFSKLLALLESRQEDEIVIAKNKKPLARITLLPQGDTSRRIGVAEGKLVYPDDINEMDDEIAAIFNGENE